ncbi:MAG: DUF4405 domain-containing protein [Candidatus Electrothrix sp. ATG1]|nr:DUF4405 domain-containing protein [Candidatus Electrothrix sp. ATG1]
MKITRDWVTPITTGSFLLTAATGVLLFFHAATGLNKAIHEWLSWVFLIGAVLHLAANFTTFKKYLAQRKGQVMLGVSVLLLALNFVPIEGGHEPPFVPPVRALAQTPLTTLAQVAQTSPEQLRKHLIGAGLAVSSDDQSISDLVGDDFGAQMHLLHDLLVKK